MDGEQRTAFWRSFFRTAVVVGAIDLAFLAYFASLPIVTLPPEDIKDTEHLGRKTPDWFQFVIGANCPGGLLAIPILIPLELCHREQEVLFFFIMFIGGTFYWAVAAGAIHHVVIDFSAQWAFDGSGADEVLTGACALDKMRKHSWTNWMVAVFVVGMPATLLFAWAMAKMPDPIASTVLLALVVPLVVLVPWAFFAEVEFLKHRRQRSGVRARNPIEDEVPR